MLFFKIVKLIEQVAICSMNQKGMDRSRPVPTRPVPTRPVRTRPVPTINFPSPLRPLHTLPATRYKNDDHLLLRPLPYLFYTRALLLQYLQFFLIIYPNDNRSRYRLALFLKSH